MTFFSVFVARILWKKNKVADMEAMTFSIFYNNALYLFLVLFASFYALRSFNPSAYPFHDYCVINYTYYIRTTYTLDIVYDNYTNYMTTTHTT